MSADIKEMELELKLLERRYKLKKLYELEDYGICLSKDFTINTSIEEIDFEYNIKKKELENLQLKRKLIKVFEFCIETLFNKINDCIKEKSKD